MNTSPASEAQLVSVENACKEFRAHWLSFTHTPFECDFKGILEDIEALDYLDYEGLVYPPSHLTGAALVWGHVLEKQLGMIWVSGSNGELLLSHDAPGNRITLWPFARVLEVQTRSLPQFRRYKWLLDRSICDCLEFGALSENAIEWGRQVMDTEE